MNNKGQVLVLFIILISSVLTVFICAFDFYNYNYNKLKIDNLNRVIIKKYYNKDINIIKDIIEKNDDSLTYNVYYKEEVLYISLTKKIKGIIIKNDINSYYKAYLEKEKIIIERVM